MTPRAQEKMFTKYTKKKSPSRTLLESCELNVNNLITDLEVFYYVTELNKHKYAWKQLSEI